MPNIDVDTLRFLQSEGVTFCVGVPDHNGQLTHFATADELLLLANDPAELFAKVQGVAKEEFVAWQADGYTAFCSAFTRGGRRCRNNVPDGVQVSARRWVELQEKYCLLHEE